jgi:hypothetical protein
MINIGLSTTKTGTKNGFLLPILANIPRELTERPRWILWEQEGTKVPKQVTGRNASSIDPQTWSPYEEVAAAFDPNCRDGVAIVLGDRLWGIDLDDCRKVDSGEVEPWAQEIVDRFQTYAEVSPSGTGLKLFFDGDDLPLPNATGFRINYEGGAVEIYKTGRYFTVTGHVFLNAPVAERTTALKAWLPPILDLWGRRHDGDEGHGIRLDEIDETGLDLKPPEVRTRLFNESLKNKPATVQGQNASSYFWAVAIEGIQDYAVSPDDLVELLEEWGSKGRHDDLSPYPWEPREVARTVERAARQINRDKYGCKVQKSVEDYFAEELNIGNQNDQLTQQTTNQSAHKPRSRLLKPSQIFHLPRKEWIIDQHIVRGQLVLLAGPSGAGKTFAAMDMGFSLSNGLPYLGTFPCVQCRVLYIASEAFNEFPQRQIAWQMAKNGIVPSEEHFRYLPASFDLRNMQTATELQEECRLGFDALPEVVIIDNLNKNFGDGNKNDGQQAQQALNTLGCLNRLGITTILVHNFGWGAERIRNASELLDGADIVFHYVPQNKSALTQNERTQVLRYKCRGLGMYEYEVRKQVFQTGQNPDDTSCYWQKSEHTQQELANVKKECKALDEMSIAMKAFPVFPQTIRQPDVPGAFINAGLIKATASKEAARKRTERLLTDIRECADSKQLAVGYQHWKPEGGGKTSFEYWRI